MINQIATFISSLNCAPENHIGYCGSQVDEIKARIEDFDFSVEDAFFIIRKNNLIAGLIGFDVDIKSKEAEVWGPFLLPEVCCQEAKFLWEEANRKLLHSIKKLNFFPDVKNTMAIDFALSLGAKKQSENSILRLSSSAFQRDSTMKVPEFSMKHSSAVTALHDHLFPGAYLSGKEIVELHDKDDNKIFIFEYNGILAGYVYVEVDVLHGESTVHFFGVDEKYRGRGYGKGLLNAGIDFIFGFDQVDEINLCVNSDNHQALRLYGEVGFTEWRRCHYLTLNRVC